MSKLNETWDDRYSLLKFPYLHYGVSVTGVDFDAGVDSGAAVIIATAAITVALPTASGGSAGGKGAAYYIKNGSAFVGNVTVTVPGIEKIDNAPGPLLLAQNEAALLVSDGSNWWILAHNP